jgi:hypothetical protein
MTVRDSAREIELANGRARLLPSRGCNCDSIDMRGSAGASPSQKQNRARSFPSKLLQSTPYELQNGALSLPSADTFAEVVSMGNEE